MISSILLAFFRRVGVHAKWASSSSAISCGDLQHRVERYFEPTRHTITRR
jgi:hypothetical protein